jgi:NAD(P)-dependent dehydrogenase (short-subunit alcohol dehydrogenase family)
MNILISGANGGVGTNLVKFFGKDHAVYKLVRKKKFSNEIECDFSKEKSVILAIKKILLLDIDIYISCVSHVGKISLIRKIKLSDLRKSFEIIFFSEFRILQAIIENMQKRNKGSIFLFSGGGATTYPLGIRKYLIPYNCSKIALYKMVEIFSSQLRKKKININMIAPGLLPTHSAKIILKNGKNLINKKEKKLINNSFHKNKISQTNKDFHDIYKLIIFLTNNIKISGKIFSSKWDNLDLLEKNKNMIINNIDSFSLRRYTQL